MSQHAARRSPLRWLLLAICAAAGCGAPRSTAIDGEIRACIDAALMHGTAAFDHTTFSTLLSRFVDERGLVDYAGLREQRGELDRYLATLASAPLCELTRPHLLALFLNAYNAYTLQTILDAPADLQSIRDLDDPWGRKVHVVGGFTLALDDIEHRILRPLLTDARVHFAVNCASVGCPPLRRTAFAGELVERQLDQVARDTLADPRHLILVDDRLRVTALLDWYRADFDAYPGGAVAFLRAFASPPAADAFATGAIDTLAYDWALNRQPGR